MENNQKDCNTNQTVTWKVNVKSTHLNLWTMTNLIFFKWGQGIQCYHQYGTALLGTFTNFYTVLKTSNSFDKPWEFITLTLRQGNIHTNTLGKYYTYFNNLYTFYPDVLKVNSQQIKCFTMWLYTCIWIL